MINHFPAAVSRSRKGSSRGARRLGWRGNGIMAQVIGGGPSLISDVINLIKTGSQDDRQQKAF